MVLFDNYIPQWQLVGCSVTRPFLSLRRVRLARQMWALKWNINKGNASHPPLAQMTVKNPWNIRQEMIGMSDGPNSLRAAHESLAFSTTCATHKAPIVTLRFISRFSSPRTILTKPREPHDSCNVLSRPQHTIPFFFPLFYSLIPKIIPYYSCNYLFLSVTFSYKNTI